jgi:hypothetical protein
MLRHVTIALAAVTLVGASLIPDDASARGGRGGGARVSAGGARISAGGVRAGSYRAHVSQPIARNGAVRAAGYRGNYYRRGVGWGVGAAAVGAAAVGAGYYGNSNNGCYYDAYGQWVCPYQNPYQY